MLRIYDRITNQFEDSSLFDESIEIYGKECLAVTFVSSLNVIDDIVDRFDKFELINGSLDTDQKIDVMKKFIDIKKRIREIELIEPDNRKKFMDGDYRVYLSKKKVIHTKMYIMSNATSYSIFVGSANFTNNGLRDGSHEYLEMTRGFKTDDYYKNMVSMFNDLKNECVDYIEEDVLKAPKSTVDIKIADFLDKEIKIVKDSDDYSSVRKNIADIFNKDVETQIVDIAQSNSILETFFTKSGNMRTKGSMEQRITAYVKTAVSQSVQGMVNEDYWSFYLEDDSVVIDRELVSEMSLSDVSPDTIVDIIDSYTENKHEDERHQVYTAFMYLFSSPYIWRIREIYSENSSPIENVPIAMNILGVGGTGKSTLLEKYFGEMLEYSMTPTFSQLGNSKGARNKQRANAINKMDGYFNSEYVKPLLVDEIPINLYTNAYGEGLVKSWSNDRVGIHPTIITTSNSNSNLLKPQLIRRMLMIPIDSQYKPSEEQTYKIEELLEGLNSEIMINMMIRIQGRIFNISEDDKKMLLKDYLYLAKDEFSKYLKEYNIDYDISPFYENYNIVDMRGRSVWSSLLIANADNISKNPINDNELIVYSRAFSGEGKRSSARALLPGGILKPSQGEDLCLDIEQLESFVGYSVDEVFKNQTASKQGKVMAEALTAAIESQKSERRIDYEKDVKNNEVTQHKSSWVSRIFGKGDN